VRDKILVITAGIFLVSVGGLGIMIHGVGEKVRELGERIEEGLRGQEEELREIREEIPAGAEAGIAEALYEIRAGNERIRQTERVYAEILEEEKKKRIEDLYREDDYVEMGKRGAAYFREGKYLEAVELYGAIARGQRDNKEARFYELYSIFLNNRMERNEYGGIEEGLLMLREGGYNRTEIGEVLEYIRSEREGLDFAGEGTGLEDGVLGGEEGTGE
jgi:hypothetical protein